MRFNRRMVIVAAAAFLLGLLTHWIPASHGQAREAKPGVVWEYKTAFLHEGGDPQESFNKLGNELGPQGWELVAISEYGPVNNELLCVFKRVKP